MINLHRTKTENRFVKAGGDIYRKTDGSRKLKFRFTKLKSLFVNKYFEQFLKYLFLGGKK